MAVEVVVSFTLFSIYQIKFSDTFLKGNSIDFTLKGSLLIMVLVYIGCIMGNVGPSFFLARPKLRNKNRDISALYCIVCIYHFFLICLLWVPHLYGSKIWNQWGTHEASYLTLKVLTSYQTPLYHIQRGALITITVQRKSLYILIIIYILLYIIYSIIIFLCDTKNP